MYRTLLVLFILFAHAALAQVRMPATTSVGVQELQAYAQRIGKAHELTEQTHGYYPTAYINGRCMVGFLGKVNGSLDQEVHGGAVTFGTQVGDILSFRIDAYHLDLLQNITGLSYVELAGKAAPELDRVVSAVRADSVHAGIYLPQGYSGVDVLIGITDWGFDYTNPMFYDTTLTTTRIRAAWDQYRNTGPAPDGYAYGTAFNSPSELLAAQADTSNIYSYATHGTHVAGIAGGSGGGSVYRGIAFSAQFLFCTFLVDAAAVLDAFTWMQDIATQDGKRLVINMSWGLHHIGTLDGNSLISQAIDQLSQEGVVFVSSAGNNGNVNFHIKKEFEGDTMRSRIQFYSYSANPNMWGQSIHMWGEPGESFSAGFSITSNANVFLQESPWYHTATQQAYLDSFLVQGVDTIFFNLTADAAHPLNGRPHFRLRVKNTSSQIKVGLKATASTGTVHFWNVTELTNDVGNWGQAFQAPVSDWTMGDANYGISEPASTESLIAVAAYSAEYFSSGGNPLGGAIATFSSSGPTLDERMKPDLTAPGVSVASSISAFTDAQFTTTATVEFEGTTYRFARFSGTSMSAPAVTGIVALMLEADPTLTPADIREILMLTARTDQHTGVIPPGGSTRWGMGKVNAYRAVLEVLGVVSVPEHEKDALLIWPNPATDQVMIHYPDANGAVTVQVTDLSGRMIFSGTKNSADMISIEVADWPAGTYLLSVAGQGRNAIGKFTKL